MYEKQEIFWSQEIKLIKQISNEQIKKKKERREKKRYNSVYNIAIACLFLWLQVTIV